MPRKDKSPLVFALVSLAIIGVLVLILSNLPVDDGPGLEAARKAGFTDVTLIESGTLTYECGEHDFSYYHMKGKNVRGEEVPFLVCCGALKACTVRY